MADYEIPRREHEAIPVPSEGMVNLTHFIYGLQAFGFVLPLTYVAAVIINYIKIDDLRGTWLESHFRWQMRTFWWGLLWTVLGSITALIVVGYYILLANAIWLLYRIIKGWLRLSEKKEMYVT